MLCWQCGQLDALEREGSPITFVFGTEVAGCLCRSCALERQALWTDAWLAELAAQDPSLTAEQLAEMRQRDLNEILNLPNYPDHVEAALRERRRPES